MFIKRPGQRTPSTSDVNWEHVDLVPKIADLMGFRVPWQVDGVSWADPSAAKRRRTQKWFYPLPEPGAPSRAPPTPPSSCGPRPIGSCAPRTAIWAGSSSAPRRLVARLIRDLAVAGGAGTARVIGLDEYRRVDLSSRAVPAHVGGQLITTTPDVPPRPAVAVAVNGVIGGVSETFASGDASPTWFAAMVPDTLLRQGGNDLQLFLLDDTAGRQRLRPLTLTH